MRLEDVTPEWVRTRMKARSLRQAAVAKEIGITQDKLSKSLNYKRDFTIPERESLARLLCEPEPPELAPDVLSVARRVAALTEWNRGLLQALLGTLEAQQAVGGTEAPPAPPDTEER